MNGEDDKKKYEDEVRAKLDAESQEDKEEKARQAALDETVDEKLKMKEYMNKADSIWAEAKKEGLSPDDQAQVYDYLTAGNLDSAKSRLDSATKRKQDEAEFDDVRKRYIAGYVTKEEYEEAHKKRGISL